jgi:hypothetical protein
LKARLIYLAHDDDMTHRSQIDSALRAGVDSNALLSEQERFADMISSATQISSFGASGWVRLDSLLTDKHRVFSVVSSASSFDREIAIDDHGKLYVTQSYAIDILQDRHSDDQTSISELQGRLFVLAVILGLCALARIFL